MISVIVTTFNRRLVLDQCLRSLERQNYPPCEFEVIVIIDGSTDGTQEHLRTFHFGPQLRVIDQPNRGLAAARNAGLHAATGELVLFLDDDLLCSPQVLSEHVNAHEQKKNIIAFGPVVVAQNHADDVAVRSARTYYAENIYGPLESGAAPMWPTHARVPPNSSISRELLERLGGFDEKFVNAHEDIELGIRLWTEGLQFTYLPKAEVVHLYDKSAKDLSMSEAERAGKSEVMLCRKHHMYRPYSTMADIQSTRLFQGATGKVISRFSVVNKAASSAIAWSRKTGVGAKLNLREERLLGLEINLNLLRSALHEAGSWSSFRDEFWVHLPVLLYHGVGEFKLGIGPELTVTPSEFVSQMDWLAENGFTPISCSEWLAWLDSAKTLPPKPIIITFDDAYAELAVHAFPVLHAHNFCATVFVPTKCVGRSNIWDQMRGMSRVEIMDEVTIREWATKGIEFGAHSRTHPELDAIGPIDLQDELEGSRIDLEQISGMTADSFAYPYGSYNQAVTDVARRIFRIAFTTEEGVNNLGTDPLRLRRTMVFPGESVLEFAMRVNFGTNLLANVRAKVAELVNSHL